jgi:predicted ATPase/DNA-binding winged helix-turn-helix (wHTH) protein
MSGFATSTELKFGRFELQVTARRLLVEGRPVKLGARAFEVLLALAERRDRVVSKHELLNLVWPNLVVEENNLQVHISALRKLLGQDSVATIPGRGYRFTMALTGDAPGNAAAQEAAIVSSQHAWGTRSQETNLPDSLPLLFGRAADADSVRDLLERNRLVSLIGAGGIGKTALALEVAHRCVGQYADGVWLVELATLTAADLVASAIAAAFNVRLPSTTTAQVGLIEAFRYRSVLLVLDNCEHLIDSVVATTAALLAACPGVRVLATSQEILHLPEEQAYRLDPLTTPAAGDTRDAMLFSAVELFAHRVKSIDRSFAITADNAPAVIEICKRLDGIALAIEMAAARVPLLGVEGVRNRLDERFRLLSAGNRVALRRHQTLRAALEWSHSHLSAAERVVFRRVGIFAGGFALHALAGVVADAELDEWEVIERLGSLVDKSLIVVEGGPAPRYRMLETTRAYALEQLADAGETAALERLHARWIARLCEDLLEVTPMPRAIDWGSWFAPELENVRAALDHVFARGGDVHLGIKLAGCAAPLFIRRHAWAEGVARQDIASGCLNENTPPEVEAWLWDGASILWRNLNHHRELAAARRSATLWQGRDEARYLRAMLSQAKTLGLLQRVPEAQQVLSSVEGHLAPWPALQGRYWNVRGILAYICDEDARTPYTRARTLFDQTGDVYNSVIASANLAEFLFIQGHVKSSEAEWCTALDRARVWADPGPIAHTLGHLAGVLIFQGQLERAEPLVQEALQSLPKIAYLFWFVPHLALRAALQARWETAAHLSGYAQAAYAALGHVRERNEDLVVKRLDSLLPEHLGPEQVASLREEGASWTEAEALVAASSISDGSSQR